jgi:hypothetical protein
MGIIESQRIQFAFSLPTEMPMLANITTIG